MERERDAVRGEGEERDSLQRINNCVVFSVTPLHKSPTPPSLPSSLPLCTPEWFSYRAHAEHNVKVVAYSLYQVSKHGVWSIRDTILLGICTQCLTYLNRQIYIYREREKERERENLILDYPSKFFKCLREQTGSHHCKINFTHTNSN